MAASWSTNGHERERVAGKGHTEREDDLHALLWTLMASTLQLIAVHNLPKLLLVNRYQRQAIPEMFVIVLYGVMYNSHDDQHVKCRKTATATSMEYTNECGCHNVSRVLRFV